MKKKENVLQIVAWSLCIVLAIALIIIVWADRKKNQELILQTQMES